MAGCLRQSINNFWHALAKVLLMSNQFFTIWSIGHFPTLAIADPSRGGYIDKPRIRTQGAQRYNSVFFFIFNFQHHIKIIRFSVFQD
jgi:hypothetical protein